MTPPEQDRGLRAVRRVRDVREQDSRHGLAAALESVRARDAEVEQARERRQGAAGFGHGSLADFRGHRSTLAGLAALESRAAVRAAASRDVAAEAQRRWAEDRKQVRAVDLLLDRRAQARAEERARAEQGRLDDLAAQGWLRRRAVLLTEETGR